MATYVWGDKSDQKQDYENQLLVANPLVDKKIKYLAITSDVIDNYTVSTGDDEYKKLSKILSASYNEGECCICLEKFNRNLDVCVKLTSERNNQCNHLIHANYFKQNNYKNNKNASCPKDKLKVKTVYLLLEDGQNFNDSEITKLAEDIKESMNVKVNRRVNDRRVNEGIRLFREICRLMCHRKIRCLLFEYLCVDTVLNRFCYFIATKVSGTEMNLKTLLLGYPST